VDNTSSYSEKELLLAIAEGSEDAFRTVYNLYRPRIYSYILKMVRNTEIASDAVQDIFLKLWKGRENLRTVDNISAYLHRMAHNQAYDGFQKQAKETLVLNEIRKREQKSEASAEEPLLSKEVKIFIQGLVDQLTPQQRKVFLLSREGGLKQEEIAERLGISIFAVKKHMVDALKFLRTEIGQRYGSLAVAIFIIYRLA